jgi:hypothetical protein
MLKSLIKFLIFLAVLFGIGYLAINPLLKWFSYKAMHYTIGRLQSPNLTLSNPSFKKARIRFPEAVTWEDFTITATVVPTDDSGRVLKAMVNVEELTLEAKEFFNGLFVIIAKGLHTSHEYISKGASSVHEDSPVSLQEGEATVLLQLQITDLADIKMQIRNFAGEMKKLSEEARTTIPIEFSAKESIQLKGKSFTLGLQIEKKGEAYCIVANRHDLGFIGRNLFPPDQTLTPADIEIIANNPLRAPQLLRIQSNASTEAANAYEQNPKVPEQAYRHVLWNYYLAREYGADFAKEVTDAHEITEDAEERHDPKAELNRRQDLNNNEVGRKYAALGYSESKILSLVMTDPEVIR